MPIQSGTHLGSYEIVSAIGAGGMGEVYRARDRKLGRDVAIKVLPAEFSRDTERLARFQREAKVLASLNHPNIATIHGLEDSGSTHALVMELVEGPTLADRIKQGPIPVDEASRIAKQICEALEYAHERGIVHRDLKPANIKVRNDDAVKVLDFGLAKAIEGDPSSIDISSSPTMSRMATMQGILLGTAAYMSPEQAKGKPVDRRADIWAFGCVLYEMLTGKQAFTGEVVTDTLAAVIRAEPDWSQLPAATPVRVCVLLRRCLQKDAKQRLRDIGDARISIDEVLLGTPEPASTDGEKLPAAGLMRLEIVLPEKVVLIATSVFGISPDGRQLAFAATGSDGVLRLWIRPLDSLETRPLLGTESPNIPPFVWSPDSRHIAFSAGGKLKRIGIAGGPAQTLCDLASAAVGGSWNPDDVIIFGAAGGAIMRVQANGGFASPVTTLDPSRGEIQHVMPWLLPDGRHFIYLRYSAAGEDSGVYIGSLDVKPEEQDLRRLLATDLGVCYVPSFEGTTGQLLFMREHMLMAQLFDSRRLELSGEPITIAERLGSVLAFGLFSASTNGVLVYRTGGAYQLTWLDQRGRRVGIVGELANYGSVSISPDGTRAAVVRLDGGTPTAFLWVVDLSRGTSARFTFGASYALPGAWSPDASRIIFPRTGAGASDLYQKSTSGVRDEELVLKSSENKNPTNWSRDGRFLLYSTSDPRIKRKELWVLPFEGDKKPIPFLRTGFNNGEGQFSPDGRFVAYVSDESGREEIYVRTFSPDLVGTASDGEGKWLISIGGGTEPRWNGDGNNLYYLTPDEKLMAVEIATTPVFRAGVPKVLFQVPRNRLRSVFRQSWDVAPDGKRFLFAAPVETSQAPFTVVLNWTEELKRLVPTGK